MAEISYFLDEKWPNLSEKTAERRGFEDTFRSGLLSVLDDFRGSYRSQWPLLRPA